MQTKQLKEGNPVSGASRCAKAKQWEVCTSQSNEYHLLSFDTLMVITHKTPRGSELLSI